MNKTTKEVKTFFNEFSKFDLSSIKADYGVAVPFTALATAKELANNKMIISSQDVHAQKSGAYTGDISIDMLKDLNVDTVVIGHSERREYHGETNEQVNEKAKVILAAGMTPIICLGETLELRESGKWTDLIKEQTTKALAGIAKEDISKIVIAYEPIWAIGTGVTASSEQAQEACALVRETVKNNFSENESQKIRIQYGGSVKPQNVKEILSKEDIDGALVGGASLVASDFYSLISWDK